MKIQPYFSEKPWGGNYIGQRFNLQTNGPIGEALLVSTLDKQESTSEGKLLSVCLNGKLPYVIKLIDANENLSIQVHPNDHFAKELENSVGKTECWLIGECQEGAGVYYGLKEGMTLESFFEKVRRNDDVVSALNFVPVKRNDFIVVPAGTIHAIGAGVRLVEFQQASGITYRIWDWGREGRELHIEKALKVSQIQQVGPQIIKFSELPDNSTFFSHSDFSLLKLQNELIKCYSSLSPVEVETDILRYNCSLKGI